MTELYFVRYLNQTWVALAMESGVHSGASRQASIFLVISLTPSAKLTVGRQPTWSWILSIGNVGYLSAEQFHQLIDALRTARAKVIDFAGMIRLGDHAERLGDVGDENKISGLRAVADHRKRTSLQFLLEENPEHGAIGTGGPDPRPIGVEDADRIDR